MNLDERDIPETQLVSAAQSGDSISFELLFNRYYDMIHATVLNFQTADDTVNKQGADVATLLEADLSASPNAIMVERQDVDKVLSEYELGI
jgi:hypothetical protein